MSEEAAKPAKKTISNRLDLASEDGSTLVINLRATANGPAADLVKQAIERLKGLAAFHGLDLEGGDA